MFKNLKIRIIENQMIANLDIIVAIIEFNFVNVNKFANIDFVNKISRKFYIKIDFELRNDFIYYNNNKRVRFCIFKIVKKNIFKTIYDDN